MEKENLFPQIQAPHIPGPGNTYTCGWHTHTPPSTIFTRILWSLWFQPDLVSTIVASIAFTAWFNTAWFNTRSFSISFSYTHTQSTHHTYVHWFLFTLQKEGFRGHPAKKRTQGLTNVTKILHFANNLSVQHFQLGERFGGGSGQGEKGAPQMSNPNLKEKKLGDTSGWPWSVTLVHFTAYFL